MMRVQYASTDQEIDAAFKAFVRTLDRHRACVPRCRRVDPFGFHPTL
jgi:hypothetical protein